MLSKKVFAILLLGGSLSLSVIAGEHSPILAYEVPPKRISEGICTALESALKAKRRSLIQMRESLSSESEDHLRSRTVGLSVAEDQEAERKTNTHFEGRLRLFEIEMDYYASTCISGGH